jgi:hypothetical protein
MNISSARLHGLPTSFLFAIKNSYKIIKGQGLKSGFTKLATIAFKDVAYRQYDYKSELFSIRRASEAINKTIDYSITNLEDFLKNFDLAYNEQTSLNLRNLLIKFGSDKGNSSTLPNLYSAIIDINV